MYPVEFIWAGRKLWPWLLLIIDILSGALFGDFSSFGEFSSAGHGPGSAAIAAISVFLGIFVAIFALIHTIKMWEEIKFDFRDRKNTRGVRLKSCKMSITAEGDVITVQRYSRQGGLYSGRKEVKLLGKYNATDPDDAEKFLDLISSEREKETVLKDGPSKDAKSLMKLASK